MTDTATLTFWDHAAELRYALIKTLFIIFLGIITAFCFYQEIFAFLTQPLTTTFDATALQQQEILRKRIANPGPNDQIYTVSPNAKVTNLPSTIHQVAPNAYRIPPGDFLEVDSLSSPKNNLVILGPLDGIIAGLKTSFWVGLVGTSPLWIYFILQFLIPALHPHERKLLLPFIGLSFLFLTFGLLFAFYLTLPAANAYLEAFNRGIGINMWSVESYLSFTIGLLLANAFAFEMFVLLLFLVHFGILTADFMISKRRHTIVAAFIIGALLTPPDIPTQLMLAIPLIGMYELAILYARFRKSYFTRT